MQPDLEKICLVDVRQSVCGFSLANSKLTLWNSKNGHAHCCHGNGNQTRKPHEIVRVVKRPRLCKFRTIWPDDKKNMVISLLCLVWAFLILPNQKTPHSPQKSCRSNCATRQFFTKTYRAMKYTYHSIKIRSQTFCVVGTLRIRVLEPFLGFSPRLKALGDHLSTEEPSLASPYM